MKGSAIRHMVVFSLRHPKGSEAEARFLRDGQHILTAIPGVAEFEVLRQVSAKFNYDFGFSMVFADRTAYEAYNNHPAHLGFVHERWETEVASFQEIDLSAR